MPLGYNASQINVVDILLNEMKRRGITNTNLQSAILAVISKESAFTKFKETCYQNTSNERIKLIFSRTRTLTDAQINALKKDCATFFNYVYFGAKYGNKLPDDGWRFVGRGYNGITGRGNYEMIGKQIGVDLIAHPELLENPTIGAKACIQSFLNGIKYGVQKGYIKNRYGINDPLNPTTPVLAAKMLFNINAGWGNDTRANYWLQNDGYQKMMAKLPQFDLYAIAKSKENPHNNTSMYAGSWLIGLMALGTFFFANR